MDAIIHELDQTKDWKGWTEEFLIEKKSKKFEEFPELQHVFYQIIKYMKKHEYFEE